MLQNKHLFNYKANKVIQKHKSKLFFKNKIFLIKTKTTTQFNQNLLSIKKQTKKQSIFTIISKIKKKIQLFFKNF